jgi:hypothetical protein
MDSDESYENIPKRRRIMNSQELFYYKQELYNRGILGTPPEITEYDLKNGEKVFFTQNENSILLPRSIESDIVIRKIIANASTEYFKRLDYIEQFIQEKIRDQILSAYLKETRLKNAFKTLYRLYKIRQVCNASPKDVDPFTLSVPEKEVSVFDWNVKKVFVFDAKSLSRHIHASLLYQEYGFPSPQIPRNPKNNVKFTYEQLISIYYQIQSHGELLWTLSTFRKCNFLKTKWSMYNKTSLVIHSIRETLFTLDTYEGRELLLDFIQLKMEDLEIDYDDKIIKLYENIINTNPTNWYISLFKTPALLHYECEHFNMNKEKYINTICKRIFRKQDKFINENNVE